MGLIYVALLLGIYLNFSLPVCLGYAFDCYSSLEDETAQLTYTMRNVAGGVFAFVIQPRLNVSVIRNTTIAMAAIFFRCTCNWNHISITRESNPQAICDKVLQYYRTYLYHLITQSSYY